MIQGAEHHHSGRVKRWSVIHGFGFITLTDGYEVPGEMGKSYENVFVHYSGIQGAGVKNLYEGEEVLFSVGKGSRGYYAYNVRPQTVWWEGQEGQAAQESAVAEQS